MSVSLPQPASLSLLVNILATHNLVDDPVESIKYKKNQRKTDPGKLVDFFGPGDKKLAHLIISFSFRTSGCGTGGVVVVVPLYRDPIFGLETCRAHSIGGKAEAPFTGVILL